MSADDHEWWSGPSSEQNGPSSEQPAPTVLGAVWQHRRLVLAIVAATVAVSAAIGYLVAPDATATATIALKTPRATNVLVPGVQGDASLARYTTQRARFVTGDAVMEAVAEELGDTEVPTLRSQVTATPAQNSNIISVEVTADSADRAVEVASAVVDAYRNETRLQVDGLTQAALESIQQNASEIAAQAAESAALQPSAMNVLSQLQLQASEVETDSALLGDGVEFVVAPRPDTVSVPGLPLREVALGLIVGLVLGASVSWVLVDRRINGDTGEGSGDAPLPSRPEPDATARVG